MFAPHQLMAPIAVLQALNILARNRGDRPQVIPSGAISFQISGHLLTFYDKKGREL